MSNILNLLLFVLFIDISFESKVSTIQMNSLEKEINKLNALVRKQNKPLEIIDITKSFLKCLNKTSIIPNKLLRAISTQSNITVTNDYEYIFAPYYNDTIRQKINNQIRECSNENNVIKLSLGKWNEISVKTRTSDSGPKSPEFISQCNLKACAECIIKANIASKKMFSSGNANKNNEKIKTTIKNLLSKFESKKDKYKIINECIINSKCSELFN